MFRTIAISTFPVSLIQRLQAIRGQYGRPVYLKSDLYSPTSLDGTDDNPEADPGG